jgi:hypothetical protein
MCRYAGLEMNSDAEFAARIKMNSTAECAGKQD